MRAKPAQSVDEYLADVASEDARTSLEKLRAIIRDELPEVQEVISYGIPSYKAKGFLVSFAAFKNHCSFFPGYTVREFEEELRPYKTSKGTVQFPPGQLLPEPLIRAILRKRWDESRKKQTKGSF